MSMLLWIMKLGSCILTLLSFPYLFFTHDVISSGCMLGFSIAIHIVMNWVFDDPGPIFTKHPEFYMGMDDDEDVVDDDWGKELMTFEEFMKAKEEEKKKEKK